MALSNSERQRRFRERLRARAAAGVTPEMVVRAARVIYREAVVSNQEPEDWPSFLASCNKKRGGPDWLEYVPDDARPNAYDWIEDPDERDLVRRVAAVVDAQP
jgi:hypothetical protein